MLAQRLCPILDLRKWERKVEQGLANHFKTSFKLWENDTAHSHVPEDVDKRRVGSLGHNLDGRVLPLCVRDDGARGDDIWRCNHQQSRGIYRSRFEHDRMCRITVNDWNTFGSGALHPMLDC